MNKLERAHAAPRVVDVSAVDRYCAADFAQASQSVRQLLDEAETEAAAARMVLTDRVGPRPADLTERMGAWYDGYVSSLRQAALDAAEAAAEAVDQLRVGAGLLVERTTDRLEDGRIVAKRNTVRQAQEKNQVKYAKLDDLRDGFDAAKLRYLQLENEHGRSPKVVKLWFYVPFLVVIGIAEALINFESFMSIKGWTPAIASGVTFVVAVALAFSSHFWGSAIRHFPVLFDPARDDRERVGQWQMMGLGTATLSLVLGIVYYARSSYFSDVLAELMALGGEPPDQLVVVGGSMISNVIVWIVGVLIAFVLHDPDPEFPRALAAKERAEQAWESLLSSLDAPLRRTFEQIDAKTQNAIEVARTRNNALSNVEQYKAARRLMERILAQDATVISALNQYRGRLVSLAPTSLIFERSPEVYPVDDDKLDAAEYAALSLRLKYV